MYEYMLVLILHAKASNSTVTIERFQTYEGCRYIEDYVKGIADLDGSKCVKVLKLKDDDVSKE